MQSRAPAKAPPVVPGTILDGKYKVERILGQGGMGLVVEARHLPDDARVALKLLLPDNAAEPAAAARFLRGASTLEKLKSEHVTRVYDIGKLDDGAPCIAMELLEGRDLARTLSLSSVLPVADAIDYVLQACEAIAEAHAQGIVHRDLKPSNLFLSRRIDGSPIVKVLDFDNALITGDGGETLTRGAATMESVLYVSPEQMQQGREVDHRTDIYTLGITLYELIGGKHPFYAETLPQLCAEILTGTPAPLSTLRPEVPEELAQVIAKAYARDREGRYPTVADFAVALAPFAPPRSQAKIDHIARMAGLPVPVVGTVIASAMAEGAAAPPDATSTRATDEASTSATPLPSTAPAPAPAAASSLAAAPPTSAPAPALPARRAGSDPHQIILGPYSAPMSARAAARFARGHANDGSPAPSTEGPSGLGRTGALALSITGILAVGGAAMLFALRSGSAGSSPAPTTSVEHVTTAPEIPIPEASPRPEASLEAESSAAPSSATPGASDPSAAESASAGSPPSTSSASTSRSAAPRAPSKTPPKTTTKTTTPPALEHHSSSR